MNKSIAIIGAGASSLLASIVLSRRKFKVSVFEKYSKVGKKLLATGNGKCNITNKNLSQKYFFSNNQEFIKYPLETFGFKEFSSFCEEIGLDLTTFENGKTYPSSLQASSVVDILYNEALYCGVKFNLNHLVDDIVFESEAKVICGEKSFPFDAIIIATGSSAMEKLGGNESGYKFAKKFGHTIIEPIPSLVQLLSNDSEVHLLNGVKTEANISLYLDNKQTLQSFGDILFTNYGVSGNGLLDLSREANLALKDGKSVSILIDIFPNFDKNKLLSILEKKKKNIPYKTKEYLLQSLINQKLIDFVFKMARIDSKKRTIGDLDKKDLLNLTYTLKAIKVYISGSKGFESAEVASGGVCTKEIDNKTFESKKQKGLYFCGEVLDVDGACGGYNLHFAWASGYLVATNMK